MAQKYPVWIIFMLILAGVSKIRRDNACGFMFGNDGGTML